MLDLVMPKILRLSGLKFGRLTVIEKHGSHRKKGRSQVIWRCACDCGAEVFTSSNRLRTGTTRSCGCLMRDTAAAIGRGHTHATRMVDISGQRFGLLTAVDQTDRRANGSVVWLCRCDCGRNHEASAGHLRSGNTRSCGCTRAETLTVHGHARKGKRTSEHVIWYGMIDRCTNKNNLAFHRYGGRGIAVCDRWMSFPNFLADMGTRPAGRTLDRVNNEGNYEPSNCRWATPKQQAHNSRKALRMLTVDGLTLCIADWAERLSVPARRIQKRLSLGWSVRDALTLPPKR